jgi:hypothetical protein
MRRILLASCIALVPGLALAQTSDNDQPPPLPSADGAGPGPGMMDGGWGGPGWGGPGTKGGNWGKGGQHGFGMEEVLMKFYAANTTHDGHLTQAQAKAGGLTVVADNFDAIDVKKRGYVTFYDIMAWRLDDMAKRLEQRADQLRAQD